MADTKISALTELAEAPATTDELVVVDKSDTAMAASGTDKRVTFANLFPFAGIGGFPLGQAASAPASTAVGVTETFYAMPLVLLAGRSISGVRYRVGTVSNGNVRSALFAPDGTTKVADLTTNDAQAAAGVIDIVNFDAPYVAPVPGAYWAALWFSSATATFMGARFILTIRTGTNAGGTPASLGSSVTLNAEFPIMALL